MTARPDAPGMLGSTASKLFSTGDTGTPGPAAHDPGAPPPDAAAHEAAAAPPLLRGRGGALVAADRETAWPDVDDLVGVEAIVAQLAPIRTTEALASSFAREANPDDRAVRAAYLTVWEDLSRSVVHGTVRRARRDAAIAATRGRRGLRGPG